MERVVLDMPASELCRHCRSALHFQAKCWHQDLQEENGGNGPAPGTESARLEAQLRIEIDEMNEVAKQRKVPDKGCKWCDTIFQPMPPPPSPGTICGFIRHPKLSPI